jgi:hypothetical protein
MTEDRILTDTLNMIEEDVSRQKITLGEIMTSLNSRGFGPILMVPALIVILPTGGIPGVPAVCGAALCVVTAQIFAGRHVPWIPQKLSQVSFTKKRFLSVIQKIRPAAKWMDKYITARFEILSNGPAQRLAAFICFILSFLMMIIGFIPLVPAALSLPIFLFGLGLTTKDGAITLTGFILSIGTMVAILWMGGIMGDEDRLDITLPFFKAI